MEDKQTGPVGLRDCNRDWDCTNDAGELEVQYVDLPQGEPWMLKGLGH